MNDSKLSSSPAPGARKSLLWLWILVGLFALLVIGAVLFFTVLRNRTDDTGYVDEVNEDEEDNDEATDAGKDISGAYRGFVKVAGGSFMMGSKANGEEDERPVHQVRVSSFYLAKSELTQKEWSALMPVVNPSFARGSDLPVCGITWRQAVEYCNLRSGAEGLQPCYFIEGKVRPADWSKGQVTCDWAANGYRLPTEAEWEFAARGGIRSRGFVYCGSNDPDAVSWHKGTSGGTPRPVMQLAPNELGLYDMGGNVSEWCWDWYDPDYYKYSAESDPKGSGPTQYHVMRSGSWKYNAKFSTPGSRAYGYPWNKEITNGIRLARSVP